MTCMNRTLYYRVSAVNDDVAASGVARDIRSQIQERSLELMCFAFTSAQDVRSNAEKESGSQGTYPMGILSLHIFFVSIGT